MTSVRPCEVWGFQVESSSTAPSLAGFLAVRGSRWSRTIGILVVGRCRTGLAGMYSSLAVKRRWQVLLQNSFGLPSPLQFHPLPSLLAIDKNPTEENKTLKLTVITLHVTLLAKSLPPLPLVLCTKKPSVTRKLWPE